MAARLVASVTAPACQAGSAAGGESSGLPPLLEAARGGGEDARKWSRAISGTTSNCWSGSRAARGELSRTRTSGASGNSYSEKEHDGCARSRPLPGKTQDSVFVKLLILLLFVFHQFKCGKSQDSRCKFILKTARRIDVNFLLNKYLSAIGFQHDKRLPTRRPQRLHYFRLIGCTVYLI